MSYLPSSVFFFLRKSITAMAHCAVPHSEIHVSSYSTKTRQKIEATTKNQTTTMLSILRSSSIDRPPLLRHPPTSTAVRKLLEQTMMNHAAVVNQCQRSLSVLPSMNFLPRRATYTVDKLTPSLSSLPTGQEGIRRLCSTASHPTPAVNGSGGGWNQQFRRFSSQPPPGNLGNIFQHAQNANKKNSKPGQTLEQYGVDLTQLAKEGKLDPVIGRHEEIRRTLQILARRTKNNPVLIGEPGVGEYFSVYDLILLLVVIMMMCLFAHIYK